MKSVLTYQGGKSRLAATIVAKIPTHTCYCEPFCGACWVLLNKDPSTSEVINDRDGATRSTASKGSSCSASTTIQRFAESLQDSKWSGLP